LRWGQLSRGTAPPPRRELGSAAHRICELLNHLALDRDTGTIAEAVRSDVALTYRLLRYANSPAIGLRRVVETVDDAVMLLGRAELYRWLSVQLMTAAQGRQASRALQESALARGRLLETLGQRRADPNANAGTLFTLGMLSMIELLMQMPMQQALQPLRLSEPVRDALLQRQGPLAEYLRLLEAIEAGNAAQAEACMRALGVDDGAEGLVEQAWAWAAAAMV
jgi:c-di-GMP phosphodiesterase